MAARNVRTAQLAIGRLNERRNAQDGDIQYMENLSVTSYPVIENRPNRYRKPFLGSDGSSIDVVMIGTDGSKLFSITKTQSTVEGITTTIYHFNYDILSQNPKMVVLPYGSGLESIKAYSVMGNRLLLAPIGVIIYLDKVGTSETTNKSLMGNETSEPPIEATFPQDIVFLCTVNNRMWGCTKSGQIYASKLGDAEQWLETDKNLTTDSWGLDMSVSVNETFTGCAVLNSRPVFFTETKAITIYGDYPTTFSTYTNEVYGIMEGCADSIAEINGDLYYLSRWGFVKYNSNGSTVISDDLNIVPMKYSESDNETWKNTVSPCCAGSDGRVYFASVNQVGNYTYDTSTGLWAREDSMRLSWFFRVSRNLFASSSDGDISYLYYLRGDMGEDELYELFIPLDIEYEKNFSLEFAPIYEDYDDPLSRKWLKFIRFRVYMDAPIGNKSATMRVRVFYDGSKNAETDMTYKSDKSGWRMVEVPCRNSNCDSYRIRLDFNQDFVLRAISREYEILR